MKNKFLTMMHISYQYVLNHMLFIIIYLSYCTRVSSCWFSGVLYALSILIPVDVATEKVSQSGTVF